MRHSALGLFIVTLLALSVSLVFAENLAPQNELPIVVCPSGVGDPVCEYRFESPIEIEILQELCAAGRLPSDVCSGLSPDRVPAVCEVAVGVAIEYAGRVCDGLERNEFCYGYETVDVSPAGLVSEPGEINVLTRVTSLSADAYNLRNAIYGITAANAHANLPLEVDDEAGLRVILFGELEMRNRVSSTDALVLPDEAVTVTVNTDTELFDSQIVFGTENTIGTATTGTTLTADVISDDGAWVRVMFMAEQEIGTSASAWISADALDFASDDDLALLAVGDAEDFTPLQNFFFSNGATGGPVCQPGTGGVLFLQAPEGIRTDYIANDAPITIIGSVAMKMIGNNTQMELTVLDGVAIAYSADSSEPVIIPAGYKSVIDMVFGATLATDAQWEDAQELTRSEMSNIAYYESVPQTLLNQPVNVPLCSVDSTGETCNIEYDNDNDANLIAELCTSDILPETLSVCE
jgi:hypothetical protein